MAVKYVIKNQGKKVSAFMLGEDSYMENALIRENRIVKYPDGKYELYSQESKSGHGEIAHIGDYFKLDSMWYPYPNEKNWFEKNHRKLGRYLYEQLPKPLEAWEKDDPIDEKIKFLIEHKGLLLNESDPEKYFGAHLWGTWLTAASDAVLVFYSITRNEDGIITDADFNFVARREFEASYHYI